MKKDFHSDLYSTIESYFDCVSDEEMLNDLAEAEFDIFNQIGEDVMFTKSLGTLTLSKTREFSVTLPESMNKLTFKEVNRVEMYHPAKRAVA